MDSSLAVSSPTRRRISVRGPILDFEHDDNDEEHKEKEKERTERRLEAINKSTVQKRRSVAASHVAGLNAAQLAQHCQDCIKLSTENKINSKNAFNFLLIDFMADMAKKKDSEINKNFQVATSTLDASVKIYACRVDAVYTDAMKMAGGFLSKQSRQALEGDDSDGDNKDGKDDPKVKTKRRKRKYTVVASDTLNAKSESEVLMDVPPKKTMLNRCGQGGQLLTVVPKYNDGCLLMVEADTPCWPFDKNQCKMPEFSIKEAFETNALMEIFSEIPINQEDKLCETVTGVEFGAIIDEEPDLDLTQTSAFEFDVNATVQDADYDEPVAVPRLAVPTGGYNSDDDINLPPPPVRHLAPVMIRDMSQHLTSRNNEYTMFDEKALKSWAGPMYGSWKPTRERHSENKENDEVSRALAEKRVRRTRTKAKNVDLWSLAESVSKHIAYTAKSILPKSTMCNWEAGSVTLTTDYKNTQDDINNVFHLPFIVQEEQAEYSGAENVSNNFEQMPEEDLGDVSNQVDGNVEPGDVSRQQVEEWDADNMVDVPQKVEKIQLGLFQKPKHVDMRQLKSCIWDVISECESKSTDESLKFDDLCRTCPKRLPKKVAETISVPVLFNALLHLANEKSLVLTQKENDSGFIISI